MFRISFINSQTSVDQKVWPGEANTMAYFSGLF